MCSGTGSPGSRTSPSGNSGKTVVGHRHARCAPGTRCSVARFCPPRDRRRALACAPLPALVRRRPSLLLLAATLAATAALAVPDATAQPLAFGSSDDADRARQRLAPRPRRGRRASGPAAYLPDTWRGAVARPAGGAARAAERSGRDDAAPGAGGLYGPEADELYDVAPRDRYVRLNPTPGRPRLRASRPYRARLSRHRRARPRVPHDDGLGRAHAGPGGGRARPARRGRRASPTTSCA